MSAQLINSMHFLKKTTKWIKENKDMTIKKQFATIITSVFLLSLAAIASAVVMSDINIYGSSSQYNFWEAEAPTYLSEAGCTNVSPLSLIAGDRNDAIFHAICSNADRYFRIRSKSSWDGILAVSGNTTNPNLTTEAIPATTTGQQCTGYTRPMIDETSCNFSTGNCTATKCVTVTGGASDVNPSSITQTSRGQLNGPAGGGFITRNFTGVGSLSKNGTVVDANSGVALSDCREFVVPFAFWVNSTVTSGGKTITNLRSSDIKQIFSGQVVDWSDIGYDPNPINVCFRHAGSGVSTALQLTEMQPADLYGLGEVVQAPNPDGIGLYGYYYNDGTVNEKDCVNTLNYSVGYFDAAEGPYVGPGTKYPNIAPVIFNGASATNGPVLKHLIETGQYDFWTVANLYYQAGNTNMANLCAFIQTSGNNGIAMPVAYYPYMCQLNFMTSADSLYPVWWGASCPQ